MGQLGFACHALKIVKRHIWEARLWQGAGWVVFWADCPAALALAEVEEGSNRGRCLIFMPNPVGINWRTRELRVENLQCVI